MITTREIINQYRNKLKSTAQLTPQTASQYLVELSAYFGNISEEIQKREFDYNTALLEIIKRDKMTVARAKIEAQVSAEYRELQTAKGQKEMVLELIRSLKYLLRTMADEYAVSKNL